MTKTIKRVKGYLELPFVRLLHILKSMKKATIPFVVEKRGDSERSYDIYSRLLEDRIIFLGSEIDDIVANSIVAQLLLLDQKDSKRDIYLYINSPGGSVVDGLAIYDTMQFVRPDVVTVCVGEAASMASVLLAAGAKDKRQVLPNSRVMIHQISSTFGNTPIKLSDQEIDLKETIRLENRINEILAYHTGKTAKQIKKDGKEDYWFSPEEAKAYGLVDQIISKRS